MKYLFVIALIIYIIDKKYNLSHVLSNQILFLKLSGIYFAFAGLNDANSINISFNSDSGIYLKYS